MKTKNNKNNKNKIAELLAIGMIASMGSLPFANAQTERVGGGGDAVVFPDDTVVLADPFIKRSGVNFELNPLLIEELKRIGMLFDASYANGTAFINENIFDPTIEFRFVSNLPNNCHRISVENLPNGSTDLLAACTEGSISWINEAIFKRMTIREQAKLIIHERLRSNKIPLTDEQIADITIGIEEMLSIYKEEQSSSRPILTDDQIYTLKRLQTRLIQAGIASRMITNGGSSLDRMNFNVHKNGGAFVQNDQKIAETSFISIDSHVGLNSAIGAHSKIVSSWLPAGSSIDENVYLYDVKVGSVMITSKGTVIYHLSANSANFGANSEIQNVSAENLTVGSKSTLSDVKVEGVLKVGNESKVMSLQANSTYADDNNQIEYVKTYTLSMRPNSKISKFYCENDMDGKCYVGLKQNSEISNVLIKFAEKRTFAGKSDFYLRTENNSVFTNVSLINLDPHLFLRNFEIADEKAENYFFTTAGLATPLIIKSQDVLAFVPKNKVLDFKNESVCPNGRLNINGHTKLSSTDKLFEMCKIK